MSNSSESWQRLDLLLDQLLELPAVTREAWLQDHCDDPSLRERAMSILAADTARGAEIEALATSGNPWALAEEALPVVLPEVPGYTILDLLGEGGMASVFLAERAVSGTVQQVALKRLRLSVHDPIERRRFEAEQRILARLEHPGIARFIDAGIAPDGVPWYAMEYVEGQTLIQWCDVRRIGIDARLALLVDICRAVHYAHQHLVIHRDIKPSNILVDEEGRIKLLDFGVAKLLDPDTGRPDATRTEHRRLTPAYAAPEQFEGRVSTASDVHALGVLLTELVSGSRPAVATVTAQDRFGKIVIGSREATARDATPQMLTRLLAGDVGMIARKAMRKEPEQRYGSALGMAEDIEAWQQGRPVAARRGDWAYRSGCFVRRHVAAVAVAAVMILVLILATVFSLRQATRANTQAEIARAVQVFTEDMLGPMYESLPSDQTPKFEELVAANLARLADDDARKPAVQAELLAMFVRTYDRISREQKALALAQRSHEFNVRSFGANDPRSVKALAMRGYLKYRTYDSQAALVDLERAHAAMRRLGIGGRDYLNVLENLAFVAQDLGGGERGLRLLREALAERTRLFGPDSIEAVTGKSALANMYRALDQWDEALRFYQEAYVGYRAHGDLRRAAIHLTWVGWIKCWTGKCVAGLRDLDTVLATFEQVGGTEHPIPQFVFDRACVMALIVDELETADAYCRRAVEVAEALEGPGSAVHSTALIHHAKVLVQQGHLAEARGVMWRERTRRIAGGATERQKWYIDRVLSDQQLVAGEYAAMRDGLLPAVLADEFVGEPMVPLMMVRVALACHFAPSDKCPEDLVARVDRLLAMPFYAKNANVEALLPLARLMLAQGRPEKALQRLHRIDEAAARPDSNITISHRYMKLAAMFRGEAHTALGDHAAAMRELKIAEADFVRRFPADHPFRLRLAEDLRQLQTTQ